MCMMPKPKTPEFAEPKLPRQPVRTQKAADFRPQETAQIGFGQKGRAGARSLRIKRQRTDSVNSMGGFAQAGGGALSIGAQVPV